MKLNKQTRRGQRGAALVEYGLIVAGVALVAAAAVSIFGTKTAGMIGASAAILPGSQAADNGVIGVGRMIQTTDSANGAIEVDGVAVQAGTNGLGTNTGLDMDQVIEDTTGTGHDH